MATLKKANGTIELWSGTPTVSLDYELNIVCHMKNKSAPHFQLTMSLAELTDLLVTTHKSMSTRVHTSVSHYNAKVKECYELRAQLKQLQQQK